MKRLLLLFVFLLQFCSYDNPFTARIDSDYIPITETGNYWLFKNSMGGENYVEVVENSANLTIDGREVIIIEENYAEHYWYIGEGFLCRYREVEINFGGELYPVESRWQSYIEIPLVLGNEWQDLWQDTIVVLNQPLYRVDELNGKVTALEDISTEAGSFSNCYRILFQLREEIHWSIIGDSILEKSFSEWYAPGIGMIKSNEDEQNWELSEYGNKGEGD
jgi:hypothetical protein